MYGLRAARCEQPGALAAAFDRSRRGPAARLIAECRARSVRAPDRSRRRASRVRSRSIRARLPSTGGILRRIPAPRARSVGAMALVAVGYFGPAWRLEPRWLGSEGVVSNIRSVEPDPSRKCPDLAR